MKPETQELINEILDDARTRVSRARVGNAGEPAPSITPTQRTTLESAQRILATTKERVNWKIWYNENPHPPETSS